MGWWKETIDSDYPLPMITHELEAKKALNAYKNCRSHN